MRALEQQKDIVRRQREVNELIAQAWNNFEEQRKAYEQIVELNTYHS